MLTMPFSVEEIKAAVWGYEGNKIPGPDGFNFTIIKKIWEVIKEDICKMMADSTPTRGL